MEQKHPANTAIRTRPQLNIRLAIPLDERLKRIDHILGSLMNSRCGPGTSLEMEPNYYDVFEAEEFAAYLRGPEPETRDWHRPSTMSKAKWLAQLAATGNAGVINAVSRLTNSSAATFWDVKIARVSDQAVSSRSIISQTDLARGPTFITNPDEVRRQE